MYGAGSRNCTHNAFKGTVLQTVATKLIFALPAYFINLAVYLNKPTPVVGLPVYPPANPAINIGVELVSCDLRR